MSDEILESAYPGIGRLYYFLSRIAMGPFRSSLRQAACCEP
jgi:hypothetical protein